jgi:hypothetical protein
MLSDLQVYALTHNGYLLSSHHYLYPYLHSNFRDTLTISAWHMLDLTRDITRAKTHFLLLTLRRTASSDPRALYSLIDVAVLPLSVLEDSYSHLGRLGDESPVSPTAMLAENEKERQREGALGSVMVMSIELPKGDSRSPQDALKEVDRVPKFIKHLILLIYWQVSVHILQPLGLFEVHKESLSRLVSVRLMPCANQKKFANHVQPPFPRDLRIKCLKNALDGGAYSMRFQPYTQNS